MPEVEGRVEHAGPTRSQIILALILAPLLSGCFVFYPQVADSPEGRLCKRQCSIAMAACSGSSYTCDRAMDQCLSSCPRP